jgi:hypothetical protein
VVRLQQAHLQALEARLSMLASSLAKSLPSPSSLYFYFEKDGSKC